MCQCCLVLVKIVIHVRVVPERGVGGGVGLTACGKQGS
jgi:hypothetical protein